MSDFTPATVAIAFWKWFGTGVAALAIVAGIILGGWRAGWWFAGQNANRQAHVIREGYSNQQTLREQITQQISNVDTEVVQVAQAAGDPQEVAALKSQITATAGIACQDASEITGDPLPAQQRQWVSANCQAGVVRPGSQYDYSEGN